MKTGKEVQKEYEMFGNDKNSILDNFDDMKVIYGYGSQVMSRLSDLQLMIENGDTERARRELNIVKMLLLERVLEKDDVGRLL